MKFVDKDLVSIQESRILMERAREAKGILSGFPQRKLDGITETVYQAISGYEKEFACLSVEETGYGCVEDEFRQLEGFPGRLMKELRGMQCVGVLSENAEKRTKDIGIPMGVAVVLCPAESPAAAIIGSALLCIKSGNAAVFVPDIRAVRTISRVIAVIKTAAVAAGCPEHAVSCLETVSDSGCKATVEHEEVSVILNLGVRKMLSACFAALKPVLYGGTGPSPVFVERSADIRQAVTDIIDSRSFNYGMMPGAEQYMVVDGLIAGTVKEMMIAEAAYFMSAEEESRLLSLLCPGGAEMDEEYIGKSAVWLAKQAGFELPAGTKVLVSEKRYIADRNPYARALRCPVLIFYIENDWMYACERCMNLLVQESKGHTLVIHSQNEEVIHQFAMKKPVARMLVNTPAVQGAMGLTTNLFPSMALGGLTAGMGVTADNISPLHLVYIRKIGYGVKHMEKPKSYGARNDLKQLLGELIRELNDQ